MNNRLPVSLLAVAILLLVGVVFAANPSGTRSLSGAAPATPPSLTASSSLVSSGAACQAQKLGATAKLLKGLFKCYAKGNKIGVGPSSTCTDEASAKFTSSFSKAEEYTGCPTIADAGDVSVGLQAQVALVAREILPAGPDGSTCGTKKLTASAKKTVRALRAHAKETELPNPEKLATKLAKADSGFRTAFEKAEAESDCQTIENAALVSSQLDTVVSILVDRLQGIEFGSPLDTTSWPTAQLQSTNGSALVVRYPADWEAVHQDDLLYFEEPLVCDLESDPLCDTFHGSVAGIRIFDNTSAMPLEHFVSALSDGWYARYRTRQLGVFRGWKAMLVDDTNAQAPKDPTIAVFVEMEGSVVMVAADNPAHRPEVWAIIDSLVLSE